MRSFRVVAMLVALTLLVGACTGGDPSAEPPATSDSDAAPTPTSDASPTATDGPGNPPAVGIDLGDARSFRLDGAYPEVDSSCRRFRQPTFDARYPGDLLVERAEGGTLRVIVTVPFDGYLEGIAEVPPSWPAAALEAQAIAARSYALARIGFTGPEGTSVETPICATAACQVYGGLPLEPTPELRRWYAAVRRTDGRSLVYGDRPADAVYVSTSNGRTYGNDVVFGSAPLPYLRGITERHDGASPTSRWEVTLPYGDLETFLTARGLWDDGRLTHVRRHGDVVELHGRHGRPARIDEGTFREAVNGAGPCLYPGRYPPDSRFGTELPLTIPSRWYSTSADPGGVVLSGRGWGHGAGLVQWGAYGKARAGWSAAEILGAYYGGLRPRAYPEPGTVRVLVAEGLTSLRVRADGTGASIGGEALDGRVVAIAPGGGGVRVRMRG